MRVPVQAPPGTAAALVKEKGLDAIRGVPLFDGKAVLYASEKSINDANSLWADYPVSRRNDMVWRSRLLSTERTGVTDPTWIYLYNVFIPASVQTAA